MEFNLQEPLQAFNFLFQLYNFVSKMKTVAGQSKSAENGQALAKVINKDLPPFTPPPKNSRNPKCQNDGDGSQGGWGGTKHQKQGGFTTMNQLTIFDALAERGYHIQLEEEIEGWTPWYLVRHLSVHEILVDIEELIQRFPTAEAHPQSCQDSRWLRYAQAAR
jgi:hypothetical protein